MKRQWNIAGTVLMLLLAITLLPGTVVQAQTITLEPERPSVEAGSTLRLFGRNFERGERVSWWTTNPHGAVLGGERVEASRDSGYVEIFFEVPEDADSGRWFLTAYGEESQEPVIASFGVIGHDPDPNNPDDFQIKVAPPSGPAGTEFAFAAKGYDDNEEISYWITAPDGSIYAAFPKGADADETGRVDLTWQVPYDAPRGMWVMTIQGYDSTVARGIRFEVF